MSKKENLFTASQAAKAFNLNLLTLRSWLSDEEKRRSLFPHCKKVESPTGSYWVIPESDLKDFTPPKMGRPRKQLTPTPKKIFDGVATSKASGRKKAAK